MFAVIQAGGKQYKVASSDTVAVEKIAGEPGDKVTLEVIAMGDGKQVALGASALSGAKVTAEILAHGKSEKVVIFKKKRRQNYRRTRGHRQPFTSLFITEIVDTKGNSSVADAAKKPKVKQVEAPAAAETATAKAAPAKKAAAPVEKKAPAAKKTPKAEAAKTGTSTDAKPAAKKVAKKSESDKAE